MDGLDSEDPKQSTSDMIVFVQNLLQQMQSRFQQMSQSIVSKNILSHMGMCFNFIAQRTLSKIELTNAMQTHTPKTITPCLWLIRMLGEIVGFFNCNALDEMGSQIDELEQSINSLRDEMGTEGSPSPLAPSNSNSKEARPVDGSA